MFIPFFDKRIVNMDRETFVEKIKLSSAEKDCEIIENKTDNNKSYIITKSRHSLLRLLRTGNPQIIKWNIDYYSSDAIKVEAVTSCSIQYRTLFYATMFILLSCFFIFFSFIKSEKELLASVCYAIYGFICFYSSFFIIFMELGKLSAAAFFDKYYEKLPCNTQKIQSLQSTSHMIFISTSIALLAFTLLFNFLKEYETYDIILIINIFIFLVLLMIISGRHKHLTKVSFVHFIIPGMALAIYGNIPAILCATGNGASVLSKIVYLDQINSILNNSSTINSVALKATLARNAIVLHEISIVLCFLYLLLLSLFLFLIHKTLTSPIKLVESLNRFISPHKESLYFQAMEPEKRINVFNICVVYGWLIVGFANIYGLYLSLAMLNKLLCLNLPFIQSNYIDLFFKISQIVLTYLFPQNKKLVNMHFIMMLVYALPIPLLYAAVIYKNLTIYIRKINLILKSRKQYILPQLREKIQAVCNDCSLPFPILIVIDSSSVDEGTFYQGFPFYKNVLVVKKTTVEALFQEGSAIDAYLAHEIYHMKKHTFGRRILCILSDLTIMGSSLLLILQKSYAVELSADKYAVHWLRSQNKSPSWLITALEILEEQKIIFSAISNDNNLLYYIANDKLIQDIKNEYDSSNYIKKIFINLKLLKNFFFSSHVISYIHPGNNYRIERINEEINNEKV